MIKSVYGAMRFFLSTCFLAVFSHSLTAATRLDSIRIWAAPDSTRLVFDISDPVQHKLTSLSNPFRIAVDIKDIKASAKLLQPTAKDRFLQRLRSGRHGNNLRVVLDLKKYAKAKSFQLPPNQRYGHRLVIDLYDDDATKQELPSVLQDDKEAVVKLRDVVIVIDAGHGGEDPGARGPKGTWEKDVVLQLARRLARKINQEQGMRAVLVREGDYYVSLKNRIKRARRHRADLFISIHADAFRDARVKGASVYVLSERGASSAHARWLAERENASDQIGGITLDEKDEVLNSVLVDLSQDASLEASVDVAGRMLRSLRTIGKLHKRRVQSAGFAVLKAPDIPSILIETAFISNPEDERRLLSKSYQEKMSNAMVSGIKAYFYTSAKEGTWLAERKLKARKHVIESGETLSEIASQYRVSVTTLRQINQIRGDKIKTGQVLTIPGGSGG
ncbi:MAG: N-acetylmuramoyl-L-alanine amidase [Gammaproteobacteria bacterium]